MILHTNQPYWTVAHANPLTNFTPLVAAWNNWFTNPSPGDVCMIPTISTAISSSAPPSSSLRCARAGRLGGSGSGWFGCPGSGRLTLPAELCPSERALRLREVKSIVPHIHRNWPEYDKWEPRAPVNCIIAPILMKTNHVVWVNTFTFCRFITVSQVSLAWFVLINHYIYTHCCWYFKLRCQVIVQLIGLLMLF